MDAFLDKDFESLSEGIRDHCIAISEELRKHDCKFKIVITSDRADVKFNREGNNVYFPKATIGVDSETCEKSLKFEDHQALVKAFKGDWEKLGFTDEETSEAINGVSKVAQLTIDGKEVK